MVEHRIGQIPFPQPRYSSDLLPRVPADTLLYISIPNLGEFLTQANQIFHDQMSQSPALQQWANQGHNNSAEIDALVEKIHDISQYLGDEAVVVGVKQTDHPGFAVLADVEKGGLADLLKTQAADPDVHGDLTVLDEPSLAAAAVPANAGHAAYALVRSHEVVFSNDIALLKHLNAQLNAGASGFAAADFGKQIASAYNRGAGIILAADLHQMMANAPTHSGSGQHQGTLAKQRDRGSPLPDRRTSRNQRHAAEPPQPAILRSARARGFVARCSCAHGLARFRHSQCLHSRGGAFEGSEVHRRRHHCHDREQRTAIRASTKRIKNSRSAFATT